MAKKAEIQVFTPAQEYNNDQNFTSLSSARRLASQTLNQVVQSYLKYYASGTGHTARAKPVSYTHLTLPTILLV